jgi:hypothetical protein
VRVNVVKSGLFSFGLLVGSLQLGGCATTAPKPAADAAESAPVKSTTADAEVASRAKARWDALIEGNVEEAYEMLSAGYRGIHSLDTYRLKRLNQPFKVKGAHVVGVQCEEADACKATVTLTVEAMMPTAGLSSYVATEEEDWFLQDGTWAHVPPE